jgi:hypothetical protein
MLHPPSLLDTTPQRTTARITRRLGLNKRVCVLGAMRPTHIAAQARRSTIIMKASVNYTVSMPSPMKRLRALLLMPKIPPI